jgi:hypothetical protein
VPDIAFESDNAYGIPTLLPDLQGAPDDGPFTRWGAISRKSINRAAWHLYTDDYRFEGLWSNPGPLVNSECPATIEANFSTSATMPRAVALWGVYKKRWLARYWQSLGVRIFVDLNVHPAHREVALLGVPREWRAFASRSHRGFPPDTLIQEHAAAVSHVGTDQVLFLVFGGGEAVRDVCVSHGWVWQPEEADIKRGRFIDGKERFKQRPGQTPALSCGSKPDMGGEYEPGPAGAVGERQPVEVRVAGQEIVG